MIDVGSCYFACDECPICEGVEYRLRIAEEGGYDPQLEYCGCDKVQTEFFISGYCEDAFEGKPRAKKKGKRKTGTEYRRAMAVKKRDDLMKIINNIGYNPYVGYVDWDWVDGVWQQTGKYIKYVKNSNSPKYWKRHSNRIVRRSKDSIPRGNQYRKYFDYWWTLF